MRNRSGTRLVGGRRFVGTVLVIAAALGCHGNPHGTIAVQGVVTIDGQPPPAAGRVVFTPVEPAAGFPHRPGIGPFGSDGVYRVQSFEPGDGLVPGTYKASVECWKTPPNMEGRKVESYVAGKYESGATSGLELSVPAKSKPITFDVEVHRK
jgi:hypothetical protein